MFPEVDAFYISKKTSRNVPKGIPRCLLVIIQSEIKLKVCEELSYLGANEYTRVNRLRTKPWEFLTQD
jgi:hypothetical protein